MKRFVLGSGVAVVALASSAQAQFALFNDRVAWIEALGDATIQTEIFQGGIATPGLSVVSEGGGLVANSRFEDTVQFDPDLVTFWTMPAGTYAWGADFDLTLGGPGPGLYFGVDGAGLLGSAAPAIGFFGFISLTNTPFSTVSIFAADSTNTGVENFAIDNLTFAVPAPGAGALMGAAGIFYLRRRR